MRRPLTVSCTLDKNMNISISYLQTSSTRVHRSMYISILCVSGVVMHCKHESHIERWCGLRSAIDAVLLARPITSRATTITSQGFTSKLQTVRKKDRRHVDNSLLSSVIVNSQQSTSITFAWRHSRNEKKTKCNWHYTYVHLLIVFMLEF